MRHDEARRLAIEALEARAREARASAPIFGRGLSQYPAEGWQAAVAASGFEQRYVLLEQHTMELPLAWVLIRLS